MKKPILCGFAALAALQAAAPAQIPSSELVLVADPLPSQFSALIAAATSFAAGEDEGWVASGSAVQAVGAGPGIIVGELLDDDPDGPRVLRVRGTYAGIEQFSLTGPRLAAGRLGYVSSVVGSNDRFAWLDDLPLVRTGQSFGTAGILSEIVSVQPLTGGDALVAGYVSAAPQSAKLALVRYPSGNTLLAPGAPVAGTGETVGRVTAYDASPSGNHVVAIVELAPSAHQAVVLDGALYDFRGAAPAIAGAGASTLFLPSLNPSSRTFVEFESAFVTDSGDVVLSASVDTAGLGVETYTFRNDRSVLGPGARAIGIDANGGALTYVSPDPSTLRFENEPIGFERFGLDIDDDGSADLGYAVNGFVTPPAISGSGRVLINANLGGSFPFFASGILRSTLKREQASICPGEPNALGDPVHLDAIGSRWVDYNRMRLTVHGLRSGTFALPLVSLSPAPPTAVSGSAGRLCLGGPIGRVRGGNALFAGFEGSASKDLFLNRLPQGNGYVAAQPGETWYAQLWYRDIASSGTTSNFSNAIAITLR